MTSQQNGTPPNQSEKQGGAKQTAIPEIIPPALNTVLRTAGVDTQDPNVTKALEISLIAMSGGPLPLPPAPILAEYEKAAA
jgi:hypothetical protein